MSDQNKWNYFVEETSSFGSRLKEPMVERWGKHIEDSQRQLLGGRIYQDVFKDW